MPVYSPEALYAKFKFETDKLADAALLLDPSNCRLREMWCAAKFGIGYSSWQELCEIDIAEEDEQREYDFHLISSQLRLPFQVVEIIDHDRKRNDEYRRHPISKMEEIYREVPLKGSQYAGMRVAQELEKKLRRYRSASDLHVLAYLNCNIGGVTWAELRAACEKQAKGFASVWVVSDRFLACLWGGSHWHGLFNWYPLES